LTSAWNRLILYVLGADVKKTLKKLLTRDVIFLDLKADNKNSIIEELVDELLKTGRLTDREAALEAIHERENRMSTGMENGIAIPHGKTDTVESLVVAIGRKSAGVEFNSIDGKPSMIFILTLSPLSHTGPHLQFLAEVSKLLRDVDSRQRLLQARDPDEVIRLFI
jgi:fructose-specific phosphotransferase system IIA component